MFSTHEGAEGSAIEARGSSLSMHAGPSSAISGGYGL